MIRLETKVKIPFLWGKSVFKKEYWTQINLIVGPNGSGKTLLAESFSQQFQAAGFTVLFLKSEREKDDEQISQWLSNEKIRNQIEQVLGGMFGKSIVFAKNIDGKMVPYIVDKNRGVEYSLRNGECHGLKEIITLLATLYDDRYNCLILDEPELHLHPQLQQFFMKEIRRVSKNNPKRIFFLVTHSPYFLDLRFPEDLLGVVATHINRIPTSIEILDEQDEQLFRRFLPRFNTYHKQFFFSDNQIFVEGYTDQQLFTNLLGIINNPLDAARTGIIDVGGKDELGVFCKVCSLLGTNGRIITDLDSLFGGKIRDVVNEDSRVISWLQKQEEKQNSFYRNIFTKKEMENPVTLHGLILKLEHMLGPVGVCANKVNQKINPEIDLFVEKVQNLTKKYENAPSLDTYKTVVMQGIINLGENMEMILPLPIAKQLPLIKNLYYLILAAIESARVYILSKGCIEHYYTQNKIMYMPVSGKDKLFHAELEYMINGKIEKLRRDYGELLEILERALKNTNN